jgi:photosystem II stability/assembly factor-like uncharacterized protein
MSNQVIKLAVVCFLLSFLFIHSLNADYTEYSDIFFINRDVGWIIGRSTTMSGSFVMHTIDGGQNWQSKLSEIFMNRVAWPDQIGFIDDSSGWLFLNSDEIFHTIDGGETWDLINSYFSPHAFQFINKDIGWATGGDYINPPYLNTAIFKTTDSGLTWVTDTIFQAIDAPLWGIDFIDHLHGVAVGGSHIEPVSFVTYTNDGGQEWILNLSYGGDPIYNVDYVDINKVWAVGGFSGGGVIAHSSDGVENPWPWQYNTQHGPLLAVQFVDTLNGWAGGREIVRTRNGGVNWEPVYLFPNDYCRSFDLCAVDSLEAWCIYNDTLYHTLDGGYNWEQPQIVSSVEPVLEVLDDFKFYIYPNPFNQSTAVYYNVPESADNQNVRLELYNTAGQRVRVLLDRSMSSGEYWTLWNGTDERGVSVASGVYILNLIANDVAISGKMTLAR